MIDIKRINITGGCQAVRIETNYLNVCLCDCDGSCGAGVDPTTGIAFCNGGHNKVSLKRLIEKDIKMVLMYRDTDGTIKPLRPELIK